MREMIRGTFPEHGILGEEHGGQDLDAEFVWVLDPIDGTKSFICGRPLFGTLIALAHRGRPVLGVIDQSILAERWVGVAGAPTVWNGRPVGTRSCPDVASATLFATSPAMFQGEAEQAAFARLERAVRLPMWGGDCYAYGLLAAGFADLVVEASMQVYDYMALVPVVAGAGGRITDWGGHDLGLEGTGQVAACGDPRLHGPVLSMLEPGAAPALPGRAADC